MSATLADLPPDVLDHLLRFKNEVEAALPGQVARITLFGSRARGDAEEDSDYDVAVFIRDLNDRSEVQSVISNLAYDHLLAGIDISPVLLPAHYADDPTSTELAYEIAKHGIVLP